ncbi:LuxR C-terminal-related transcriptional regulator [Candidatus Entotheonella palauensis]|uniref:LuxR family transcriptional regulator n=1 Tax=Candidatus Entotheonella gemina TaxID=1429439 RepID=W4LZV9_9BACT|nr:response regulator transcription factor [Candidatus Entotheonella palauensis]ETX03460.1 MAG: hypothetical protein ETSY2_33430 [Candidatus Entotheonella gemina]
MNQPIRIYIIHEHQLLIDVVTALLRREQAIALVGEAANLDHLIPADGESRADVILLDAALSALDARQVTWRLKCTYPTAQVIVMGLEPREEAVLQFIEAGASGYLLKHASYSELLYTINAVHQGQTPCSPRIAALVFARIKALTHERYRRQQVSQVCFTQREREVLQLLASGHRNHDIAQQLGIALETVKRHVGNIFDKLQVRSRREVIQRVAEGGLLDAITDGPSSRVA